MNAQVLSLMTAGSMLTASTQMAHIPVIVKMVFRVTALTVQVF